MIWAPVLPSQLGVARKAASAVTCTRLPEPTTSVDRTGSSGPETGSTARRVADGSAGPAGWSTWSQGTGAPAKGRVSVGTAGSEPPPVSPDPGSEPGSEPGFPGSTAPNSSPSNATGSNQSVATTSSSPPWRRADTSWPSADQEPSSVSAPSVTANRCTCTAPLSDVPTAQATPASAS